MKRTPLFQIHKSLGAKMIPFAGYEMPVQYDGIKSEHMCVRNHVGVFDVSHMGELIISGTKSFDLVQSLCSNDVSNLDVGDVQYTCLPNQSGGIIDDLLLYKLSDNVYFMVVNANNIKKDFDWINANNNFGARIENQSDNYSMLAIQGPKALSAMQSLCSIDLLKLKNYKFKIGVFAGIENVIISKTGYTGSGGIEIYCANKHITHIWKEVFNAGKKYNIKPIGLAARNTLRLEMGFCLYGNDIDKNTSPIEAGLGWITKFTKPFTNSNFLLNQKKVGVLKKLVCFELTSRGVPRKGYELVDQNGRIIGVVTSGTMSPSLSKGIGMGYVLSEFASAGTKIAVKIRKNTVNAVIVIPPIYKS